MLYTNEIVAGQMHTLPCRPNTKRDQNQAVLIRSRSTHHFSEFVGKVGSMSETHGMPSFFISTAIWKR